MPLLEIDRLNGGYGLAQILFDVTMSVDAGEVVVLLGRNGAGKSTLLKTINAMLRAWSGRVRFDGQDITHAASHVIARLGLGYVPEERRVFAGLTVRENLEVGHQPSRPNAPVWDEAELFRLFPNLAAMHHRRGGQMSGGEQQMLTIARTLMGNPRLVLLDEPSEGLAPVIVDAMAATIRRLKGAGLAILLCEQNLGFAARIADRAYVIEKGQIVHQGQDVKDPKEQQIWRELLGLAGDK